MATIKRRYLRSAHNYCSKSIGANVSIRNSNDHLEYPGVHSRRYYSIPSTLDHLLARGGIVTTTLLPSLDRHCDHCIVFYRHERHKFFRRQISSAKKGTEVSLEHLPFFKSQSKIPPSTFSVLKQEEHELSAEELLLKKALEEYISYVSHRKTSYGTDKGGGSNEEEYLLENLQKAYVDLEYWEEALQIEVYKCKMYYSNETDEYADSVHAQGKYYLRQENFTDSKQMYEEALDYFQRTENLVQQGHVLISLAGWYFFRNQLDDALESLKRSEVKLDSNPALLYKCLDNQGLIYRLWGEFHVALDKYNQALQVVVSEDTETRSALKMHIADMHLALEQPDDALMVYQELLLELSSTSTSSVNTEHHKLGMQGVLLHNIATIHVDKGDHQFALRQFQDALEAKKAAGGEYNPEVAKTLNSLGALHAGSFGEKEIALEYFQQALIIARIHADDRENPHKDPDVLNVLKNISVIEQDLAEEQKS